MGAELMEMVRQGMMAATPGATDYQELRAVHLMRSLYKPTKKKLTPEQHLRLTKAFRNLTRLVPENELQDLVNKVKEYDDMLLAVGRRDRDVRENMEYSYALIVPRTVIAATFIL